MLLQHVLIRAGRAASGSLLANSVRTLSVRFCSHSDGGKKKAPENFYDENVEKEKELMDYVASIKSDSGIESLTTVKDSAKWADFIGHKVSPSDFNIKELTEGPSSREGGAEPLTVEETIDPASRQGLVMEGICNPDLGDHFDGFEDTAFVPPKMLDYSQNWRQTTDYPNPHLEGFVKNTSREKFRFDEQGYRSCPGRLQRKGLSDKLNCHLIDLDAVNHLDVMTLRNFLTEDAEIKGRKLTGLCARCQRQVAKTIKRSRHLGILPHLGEYVIRDSRPLHQEVVYHDVVEGHDPVESKTIL